MKTFAREKMLEGIENGLSIFNSGIFLLLDFNQKAPEIIHAHDAVVGVVLK